MIVLLIKLGLAHIVGDFFLQPNAWVKHKETHKLKSKWLYIHTIIHILLMWLLLWQRHQIRLVLTIGVAHLVIDGLKLSFQNEDTKRLYFFIDQMFHLFSMVIIAMLFSNTVSFGEIFSEVFSPRIILLLLCLGFLTKPSSVIMKTVFLKWDISALTKKNKSLENAGNYIGILERVLIFVFVILGRWEAVGFLIAAKSVFRFGDLTASKERMLTEYILIGTLMSFGIAISVGLLFISVRALL